MSILINPSSEVIIQGMTGKEGQRALAWMRQSGVKVVAGVTPGKGGQEVDGVPVYNSVAEALVSFPHITLSCLYVPPRFVLSAATEAITAGLSMVYILAEGVPSLDTVKIVELARQHGTRIIGPSSIGFAYAGVAAVGSMGGGDLSQFMPPSELGGVAVLSKSGGMATTIANLLAYSHIPQTLVIGIGGDRLIGTTYADLLPDLANDQATKAVVIIGEIGGAYEEMLATAMTKQSFSKPVIAFISGLFAETLPQGVSFGHAGAIVSKSEGTRQGKIEALQQAGALIATTPSDIVPLLRRVGPWQDNTTTSST